MKRAPLILAAFLQVMPFCRVAVVGELAAPSSRAIVFTWLAGMAAFLGSYDAVSGASASVAGLVKYSGSTPVGQPTNYVAEPVDQVFKYRITVTNPGVDFAKNYFDCIPLPPGLTINTNAGSAGYITGTPTAVGIYAVTLVAGNLNFPTPSTAAATIIVYPTNTPPLILIHPQSQSILVGTSATFSVVAEGTFPLFYQWLLNGTTMANRNADALILTNVTTTLAGDYSVFVTNAFGSVTSLVARLTVRDAFLLETRLGQAAAGSNGFRFVVTGPIYTNYIIWSSQDLKVWTPIKTNWVIDGFLDFIDPDATIGSRRFYRASLSR